MFICMYTCLDYTEGSSHTLSPRPPLPLLAFLRLKHLCQSRIHMYRSAVHVYTCVYVYIYIYVYMYVNVYIDDVQYRYIHV